MWVPPIVLDTPPRPDRTFVLHRYFHFFPGPKPADENFLVPGPKSVRGLNRTEPTGTAMPPAAKKAAREKKVENAKKMREGKAAAKKAKASK